MITKKQWKNFLWDMKSLRTFKFGTHKHLYIGGNYIVVITDDYFIAKDEINKIWYRYTFENSIKENMKLEDLYKKISFHTNLHEYFESVKK